MSFEILLSQFWGVRLSVNFFGTLYREASCSPAITEIRTRPFISFMFSAVPSSLVKLVRKRVKVWVKDGLDLLDQCGFTFAMKWVIVSLKRNGWGSNGGSYFCWENGRQQRRSKRKYGLWKFRLAKLLYLNNPFLFMLLIREKWEISEGAVFSLPESTLCELRGMAFPVSERTTKRQTETARCTIGKAT